MFERTQTTKLDAYLSESDTYDPNGALRFETTFVTITATDKLTSASTEYQLSPRARGRRRFHNKFERLSISFQAHRQICLNAFNREDVGNVLTLTSRLPYQLAARKR